MGNSVPVWIAPADAFVRRALTQIEAAEALLNDWQDGSVIDVSALIRFVEDAAQSLENSESKQHSMWIEANDRVDRIIVSLSRWSGSSGKTRH